MNGNSRYGINAFYDHDLVRDHRRASIGAEYGINNINLSGNYYFPLSDWQRSDDFLDSFGDPMFDERPASGFDLTASAWLPSYPWISADLNYQQYFGDHVEVSNGDDPVKDPTIAGVTLNYQPIPLLTFSAGYSKEDGGAEGMEALASLTYNFGVPLAQQLDSNQVRASRTSANQLFNLVQRDHNIRLEYQKRATEAVTVSFTTDNIQMAEGSRIELATLLNITGNRAHIAGIHYEGSGAAHVLNEQFLLAPVYVANQTPFSLTAVATLTDGSQVTTPLALQIVVTPETKVTFNAPTPRAGQTLIVAGPEGGATSQRCGEFSRWRAVRGTSGNFCE